MSNAEDSCNAKEVLRYMTDHEAPSSEKSGGLPWTIDGPHVSPLGHNRQNPDELFTLKDSLKTRKAVEKKAPLAPSGDLTDELDAIVAIYTTELPLNNAKVRKPTTGVNTDKTNEDDDEGRAHEGMDELDVILAEYETGAPAKTAKPRKLAQKTNGDEKAERAHEVLDELDAILAEYSTGAPNKRRQPQSTTLGSKQERVNGVGWERQSNEDMDELDVILAEYDTRAPPEKKKAKPQKGVHQKPLFADKKQKTNIPVPMDKVLFGDKASLLQNLAKAAQAEEVHAAFSVAAPKAEGDKQRKPAWTDVDDEALLVTDVQPTTKFTQHLRKDKTYKEYLAARFTNIAGQPKWAKMDEKRRADDSDEEILRTVGFATKKRKGVLGAHNLETERLKDTNRDSSHAEGVIHGIEFHPTSTAALVVGNSGVATIYAIDGRQNEKLHNIIFQNYPITCARITPCGTKAVLGSVHRHYYGYDLLTAQEQRYKLPADITTLQHFQVSSCGKYMASRGRFGLLHLFQLQSHELLHTFQQPEEVTEFAFSADSQRLICSSRASDVNVFSLRQRRLEHAFLDDGCIHGSALALAPNQRLLALGSEEGAVNVYDFEKVMQTRAPQPLKTMLNLRTGITHVRFNHSSELLAFCSDSVPNAVRVAHFPSGTVYANFPLQNEMGRVRLAAFSPASGFMTLAARKEAPLYRLKHFSNY